MRPGVSRGPTAPVFTQKALSDLSHEREGTAFKVLNDVNHIKINSHVLHHQSHSHRRLFLFLLVILSLLFQSHSLHPPITKSH